MQLATVALGLCLLGFGAFLLQIPAPAETLLTKADGIVALTGDTARLGPAEALLEQGKGERLLITGVNRITGRNALRSLLGGTKFDCCVDLGFQATDTRGNAAEAAAWARAHRYTSLIVVTSDYHMPRSLLEFSAQMPDVRLIPYAVAPDKTEMLPQHRLPRLLGEYAKYVAGWMRRALSKETAPATPQVSP